LNRHIKFGRVHSRVQLPHLQLSRYTSAALPQPPATVDYSAKAIGALRNVFDNDQLGDCVIAGAYHVTALETGNAGDLFIPTNDQLIADYSAIGGYVPGDESTDQGCDIETACTYFKTHGFANGTKIIDFLKLDGTDPLQLKRALYAFGNLYFGGGLADAWVNPMPSEDGFFWDAGEPDAENGHCIMAYGYNDKGLLIDSWGLLGTMSWAAVAAFTAGANNGEIFSILTPDQLQKGKTVAPNGIHWDDLINDWNALGGKAPVAQTPAVVQTPLAVTLEEAETAVTTALQNLPTAITRAQAITAVSGALNQLWGNQHIHKKARRLPPNF